MIKKHPLHIGLALILLVLSSLASATRQVEAAPPVRSDVLIGFQQAPGPNDLALIRAQGGRVKYSYNLVPAVAANLPQEALAGLAKNPNIIVIEPDGTVQAIGELENVWGVTRIGADIAHADAVTGFGVKVAVIDSGVDYDHFDLKANYAGGHDFVNDDDDPFDDNSHGTHCAGTIGAVADGFEAIGVAPEVELYALKVLDNNGSGSFSDIIAALEWCVVNEIQVTNNSYGASQNPGSIVEQAFINANNRGVLNIAAAGNSGTRRGKGNNVNYPARYAAVVAVGATDQNDDRAYFSSTGPDVELAAPGYQIYSTVPGGYATYSGTSMACPHVVGAAALLIQAGQLDNEGIRGLLALSSLDLGSSGPDDMYGYGLVDVVSALSMLGTYVPPPEVDPPTDPPAGILDMKVADISYHRAGGKNKDRDLIISVVVQESVSSLPVPNATVSINVELDSAFIGAGSGTTDSTGVVSFRVRRASSGMWTTEVTGVTAEGYLWDGITPP